MGRGFKYVPIDDSLLVANAVDKLEAGDEVGGYTLDDFPNIDLAQEITEAYESGDIDLVAIEAEAQEGHYEDLADIANDDAKLEEHLA